jgi:DNA-directed RNA polymerase specialized sigma24 family protein
LGIPAGTVRSRLARAYGELREMLAEQLRKD